MAYSSIREVFENDTLVETQYLASQKMNLVINFLWKILTVTKVKT